MDVLNDLTPALRERRRKSSRSTVSAPSSLPRGGPPGGPLGTLMLPADVGGANWPGGLHPETNRLYIHSHTAVFTLQNIPADLRPFDPGPSGHAAAAPPAAGPPPAPPSGGLGPRPGAWVRNRACRYSGEHILAGHDPTDQAALRPRHGLRYEDGEMLWQKPHTTTPDNIRNNPALAGLDVARLGAYGRIFIGTLTTKKLVIAGEGDVHTNAGGKTVALLRAYDKETARISGRGGDAGQANRVSYELSAQRQAVYRGGCEPVWRQCRRRVDCLCAAVTARNADSPRPRKRAQRGDYEHTRQLRQCRSRSSSPRIVARISLSARARRRDCGISSRYFVSTSGYLMPRGAEPRGASTVRAFF